MTKDGPHHREAEPQPQPCKNHAPSYSTVLVTPLHYEGESVLSVLGTVSFLNK